MNRLVVAVTAVLTVFTVHAWAQSSVPEPGSSKAAQARLEATVRFLADDLLEGRETPSRGLDLAALYLANELRAAGLQPGNKDDFLQTYDLQIFKPAQTRYRVRLNGVPLKPEEFFFANFVGPKEATGRFAVVFGGQGLVSEEHERDDYAGVDLKNKAVVVLPGAPWGTAESFFDPGREKLLPPGARGAIATVIVSPDLALPPSQWKDPDLPIFAFFSQLPITSLVEAKGLRLSASTPILLVVTPKVFDRALAKPTGANFAAWTKRLAAGEKVTAKPLDVNLEIQAEGKPNPGRAANVVAVFPGTDPTLKDEWIVLSAHYDHLGLSPDPKAKDRVFNGADDNASGTAAVLEVALRMASGPKLRRSVMVLFTSGEEHGFTGSGTYSLNPLVPPAQMIANLNVDMVGRSDGTVQAIADVSPDLFLAATAAAKDGPIRVVPDQNPSWHLLYFNESYHFARLGVPTIHFFTADHADYHQPSDSAEKINFPRLAQITEVIYRMADRYAQGAPKPKYQRPAWFLTPE